MDAIPEALRPLVKRLETIPDLERDDLISIIFVVRLGDELHRAFYGTFLTISLVDQLCEKLGITDLTLEVDVFVMRWSFRQGSVSVAHRMGFDYDMEDVSVLSKIGWGVLDKTLTSREGLRLIRDHRKRSRDTPLCRQIESWYRDFPGRAFVIPLMAATCATVYFGGTWHDLGFAAACGLVSGIVAWISSCHEQLTGIMDYVAAILTAMIATSAVTAFPDSTCFTAQVLGTLYWFLYGTAFVMSLYEITNNQLMTGVTRFLQATLRSYGLAFGALLGVWLAAYGGGTRWDAIEARCTTKTEQIPDIWFILLFPLSAIACLFQFRVKLAHFPICLIVQTIAYGFQYLIGTVWKQPEFLSNMVPAFLATIASQVCIVLAHRLKVSNLEVRREAYLRSQRLENKKKTDEEEVDETALATLEPGSRHVSANRDSDHIAFVEQWAEAKNNEGGYTRGDKLLYARSDLWFCLLPALYLLVPGSKLLQTAFDGLIGEVDGSVLTTEPVRAGNLATSLFTIALSQVIGLRLGFATLWACSEAWAWTTNGCCCGRGAKSQKQQTDAGDLILSPSK